MITLIMTMSLPLSSRESLFPDGDKAYTRHPTIGSVGLSEPEAREKYGDKVKVYTTSVSPSQIIYRRLG
jgi:hypothetical protein